MATLGALLAANRRLRKRDFTEKVCRLVEQVETKGGTVFEEGELVRVHAGWRGRWQIRSLEPQSNGVHRHCYGVSGNTLELVGDAPPPSYVPKPPSPMVECAHCKRVLGRDLAFRGCCNPACWAQAHPDAADRIIRAHFKRSKETD